VDTRRAEAYLNSTASPASTASKRNEVDMGLFRLAADDCVRRQVEPFHDGKGQSAHPNLPPHQWRVPGPVQVRSQGLGMLMWAQT
jgi:hypothetical protein